MSKTVYVILDSHILPPHEGQRVSVWPDDMIVQSAEPLGSEYVLGDWGSMRPRRWKVVLRPPTDEEEEANRAYWAGELEELEARSRWWEFWR